MYRVHLNGWYLAAPALTVARWTREAAKAAAYSHHDAVARARLHGADLEPADHDNRAALL